MVKSIPRYKHKMKIILFQALFGYDTLHTVAPLTIKSALGFSLGLEYRITVYSGVYPVQGGSEGSNEHSYKF